MKTRINNILSSLETSLDDVRMIGIKGMGGGGKTTLARAIFNQISFQFEGASFVENVREVSLFGLKSLQKQILSDVFIEQGVSIRSVDDGIYNMKRRMHSKKVLIVLDDVDHIEQLEALAGHPDWFKPGSRIIITTRDEQVLVAHGVKSIHNIMLLLDEEAIWLFSRYAFGRATPNQGYEELSRQVVYYAAGLPLTIRVLGSSLCGKTEPEWKDALERLKTIPLMETLKKLEISYTSLEEDCKEIFLNVACIMKGWSKDLVIKALESCKLYARYNLRVLEQKSLITVTYSGSLGMHDHIEEMGKNIVRRSHPDKPSRHSRLWVNEEIKDILSNDLGTKATRYITFNTWNFSPEVVMKGLRKIKELRFLHVSLRNNDESKNDYSRQNCKNFKFPDTLRYLCWSGYPFRSLPKTFQADNLVALEMTGSKIIQLWEGGERKILNKLRFLDLSCSMLMILDLGLTPNIETLNLKGCGDLVEVLMLGGGCLKLITVVLSFSMLSTLDLGLAPNIELLDLEGCLDLVEIHMPNRSPNLRSVKLSNSKLRTLDMGSTPNLEYLDLRNCCDLEELHMADKCHKLAFLNISHSKLRKFDLGLTPNLEKLDLQSCYNLTEIHMADECLEKLVYFDLSSCLRFEIFVLHVEYDASCSEEDGSCNEGHASCREDESLKIGPLAELHLNARSLDGCRFHSDNNLPKFKFTCYYKEDRPLFTRNLEKLISVGLCACTNLETFSRSICGLQHLRKLKLTGSILEAPKDLDHLESLEELHLSYTKIKHLPDNTCMLKHLKLLELNDCSLLEKLPEDLGRLECLEKLTLSSTKIKDLPDSICMLKNLECLDLSCSYTEKLPEDLGQLESLKKLYLSTTKIKDLPDSICMMKHLESLNISYCSLLEKLPKNLGQLECLKELNSSSTKIKDLPDSICMLKHLEYLQLNGCSLLEKLPEDIGRLACLKKLTLSSAKIKDLPDSICMLKHLQSLEIKFCLLLEKLPEDLGRLESLKNLNLNFCKLLRDIPDSICKMKSLECLSLSNCIQLEKLPEELGFLERLKFLTLEGLCISHLPQSISLLKGLCIVGEKGLLQSSSYTSDIQTTVFEAYSYVQGGEVSNDDFERLGRPEKKTKIN